MAIIKALSKGYWQVHNKKYFFLVAAFSILINWAGHTFVYENSYNFLYFDMIGTFVAVVVLGSVWGMLTALATSILLSSVTSPHFIYLAVVNMTGALYWGILNESGLLAIFKNKNYSFKSSLKSNFSSAILFILFYGVGCGLLTALTSSVIRGVIFEEALTKPYSLYFAQWFKQVFEISANGGVGMFANFVADTFIEIPDKVLSAFFGMAICLTIFKFNIKTFTESYQNQIQKNNISWHRIMLRNFGGVEIFMFIVLGVTYLLKIKTISMETLTAFIEKIPSYSPGDYVFLEFIMLPLFIIFIFLAIKFFMPGTEDPSRIDLGVSIKDNFNIKNLDRDIKNFLIDAFCLSVLLTGVYIYILVSITGITPIAYYKLTSNAQAQPELLAWVLIMFIIFILIDRKNNRTTEIVTLNDELIKKQAAEQISETFDEQKQKLQALELSWSDSTVAYLKSARHDLINQLEKSKTGLSELLTEVYDGVVKPYSVSVLESQKKMRAYIEEITSGKLNDYDLKQIEENIEETVLNLRHKAPYINVHFSGFKKTKNMYCRMNGLFFAAFNNIVDNSVYALQKRVLEPGFSAHLTISLETEEDKEIAVKVSDTAGGLSKDKISLIYKFPLDSSKGGRVGEGTMIVKNFVKLLDGYVTAHNVRSYNETGLETVIYLPYFKRQEEK
ncbi:MAG: ATP-binding protein [Endomicrobia bacterium]|nr:ATP-binding protein [Endomicrobiia bacterium]MCL2506930.1 ATP-binding protein [Endomicrobiia bacterium]